MSFLSNAIQETVDFWKVRDEDDEKDVFTQGVKGTKTLKSVQEITRGGKIYSGDLQIHPFPNTIGYKDSLTVETGSVFKIPDMFVTGAIQMVEDAENAIKPSQKAEWNRKARIQFGFRALSEDNTMFPYDSEYSKTTNSVFRTGTLRTLPAFAAELRYDLMLSYQTELHSFYPKTIPKLPANFKKPDFHKMSLVELVDDKWSCYRWKQRIDTKIMRG